MTMCGMGRNTRKMVKFLILANAGTVFWIVSLKELGVAVAYFAPVASEQQE